MIISTQNLQQAKDQIKKSSKPIIVRAQSDEFNRKILEYGKFDILLSLEDAKSNSIRKINSGFNHVLAKIAAKNKIALGIDMQELAQLGKKDKAQVLSKIIQNIQIARKAKCQIKVLNFTDKTNALNFLLSLGASTQQAKNSF